MKHILTFFLLTITVNCLSQTSDDEKYQQAKDYYDAKAYDKAVPILEELANRNHAKAICKLGGCYLYEQGVAKDEKKAFDYFMKSADLGYILAYNDIGFCYQRGFGVVKNEIKAFEWYKKAAEQGGELGEFNLGASYENGFGCQPDYNKAFEWYRKSADKGNEKALCNLGHLYNEGLGVERDLDKAYDYYIKSAAKGNTQAMINLAWLHQNNEFQEAHPKEDGSYYEKQTEKWLHQASKAGDAKATYYLGVFYSQNSFDNDDYYKYYKKSAEGGYGPAQAVIGISYLSEKRYDDAIKMFESAKEQGCEIVEGFDYVGSDDGSEVGVLLMLCHYLKQHNNLKLEHGFVNNNNCEMFYGKYHDKIIITVSQNDGKQAFQMLSIDGKLLLTTPFFHTNLYYSEEYKIFSYKDVNETEHEILIDEPNIDVLIAIDKFFNKNNNFKFKDALCKNENEIYVSATKDSEQDGCIRLNKNGAAVSSSAFTFKNIYLDHHAQKFKFNSDSSYSDEDFNLNILQSVKTSK